MWTWGRLTLTAHGIAALDIIYFIYLFTYISFILISVFNSHIMDISGFKSCFSSPEQISGGEGKLWIILYRNMYIVKKLCFLYDVFKYYDGVPINSFNLCFPTTNFDYKRFLPKQFVKQCFKQYFINVDIVSLIFNTLFYFLFYVKVFLDIHLENTFSF